jgi:hypothetical protein
MNAPRCPECDRHHPHHADRCPLRPEPCGDCGKLERHADRCPLAALVMQHLEKTA